MRLTIKSASESLGGKSARALRRTHHAMQARNPRNQSARERKAAPPPRQTAAPTESTGSPLFDLLIVQRENWRQQEELTELLSELKKEEQRLQDALLQAFEQAGSSSVNHNGYTYYIHKQLWVKVRGDKDRDAAMRLLRAMGLGDYITENFNSNSLSSYFREQEAMYREEHSSDPDAPPWTPHPRLRGVFDFNPTYSVRSRKASAKDK